MRNCGLKIIHSLYFSFNFQSRDVIKSSTRSFTVSRPFHQQQSCSPYTYWSSEVQTQFCGCFTRSNYNVLQKGSGLYPMSAVHRFYTSTSSPDPTNEKPEEPKQTLYQRFKAMYRDYWYVLIPVHVVTSAAWFGGFYYMVSSGVDIVALLEWMNVSDKLISPFRNGHSKTGYVAIVYALYKIATPLRYTVTLGGTTLSINYLKRSGYIKPVPSKDKLKEMYADKKGQLIEKGNTLKDNMMQSLKPSERKKKDP